MSFGRIASRRMKAIKMAIIRMTFGRLMAKKNGYQLNDNQERIM
jgi:hypothetical protein